MRTTKTLISLCGSAGWLESSLGAPVRRYVFSGRHLYYCSFRYKLVHAKTSLRKHAYLNTLKILHQKIAIFLIKNSDIFHMSAQNIDCGYLLEPSRRGGSNEYPQSMSRRGGSNEYPQSMFLSRNNKNNVYPCKPQFYYIKVGFKGVKII